VFLLNLVHGRMIIVVIRPALLKKGIKPADQLDVSVIAMDNLQVLLAVLMNRLAIAKKIALALVQLNVLVLAAILARPNFLAVLSPAVETVMILAHGNANAAPVLSATSLFYSKELLILLL
jgi:hypothetical protein